MVTMSHSKECRLNQQPGVCMFIDHITHYHSNSYPYDPIFLVCRVALAFG